MNLPPTTTATKHQNAAPICDAFPNPTPVKMAHHAAQWSFALCPRSTIRCHPARPAYPPIATNSITYQILRGNNHQSIPRPLHTPIPFPHRAISTKDEPPKSPSPQPTLSTNPRTSSPLHQLPTNKNVQSKRPRQTSPNPMPPMPSPPEPIAVGST